jgi:hypothetical protein
MEVKRKRLEFKISSDEPELKNEQKLNQDLVLNKINGVYLNNIIKWTFFRIK